MRKSAVAAGLALALTSAASWAGGIQIAIEGDGAIGNSVFVGTSIGNTEGNALLEDAIVGISGGSTGNTATWYGHNSFDISSFTGFAAELTIDFSMEVDVTLNNGPSTAPFSVLSMVQTPGTTATLNLYYDDFGRADSDVVAGIAANAATGLGYTDGVLVASGAMTLGAPFTLQNTTGTATANLAVNNATQTIQASGGTTVGIDFLVGGLNLNYIVNDLAAAVVDMSTANALTTSYDGVVNALPPTQASAAFATGTVTPNFGADGENDFDCGGTELCDIQTQMNTTVLFVAGRIPEPGTLALLGLGLSLIGRRSLVSNK